MTRLFLSTLGATALLVGAANVSSAQKVHIGGQVDAHVAVPHPKPEHEGMKAEAREIKEAPKVEAKEAEKAERKDEKRAEKVEQRTEKKVEQRTDKIEKRAEKADERAEKAAERTEKMTLREAHEQSSRLLHGIKLTAAERRTVGAIDRKYEAQFRALKKQEHAADKSGASDAAYQQQILALAAQERTEIRAALPVSAQARFDANAAARAGGKH